MAIREYESAERADEVLKEAVWLAWQAAGGPSGMGFMRDNTDATKESVWDNAYNRGDYYGRGSVHGNDLHADYVFGRMLKLRVRRPDALSLEVHDYEPRRDYQSWCCVYPTFSALFDAAEKTT